MMTAGRACFRQRRQPVASSRRDIFQCRRRRRSSTASGTGSRRIYLSTSIAPGREFSVPLALADVHLRLEQLPFAYAFEATLDPDRLIDSLGEVLRRHAILGSTVDFSEGKVPTLECNVGDAVPVSFGRIDATLDEWLVEKRSGEMQHVGWNSGGGAPVLSPLFDDLSRIRWTDNVGDEVNIEDKRDPLSTVRITYFKESGTAIGINISHLLGDANTCFRICQVWGRAMRGLAHPSGMSNARAEATVTGMVTPTMASLLNLPAEGTTTSHGALPFYSAIASYFDGVVGTVTDVGATEGKEGIHRISEAGGERSHEYARLEYSPELLRAMKAYGMSRCSRRQSTTADSSSSAKPFVSTNDMIAAMGWLMKRRIAERPEWNLSTVVNLRNRGGIDGFGCVEDPSAGTGVFGNALASVVAELPRSTSGDIAMEEVCDAAVAIRNSLTRGLAKVEYLRTISLSGETAASAGPDQGNCFSTTSWMQFPLWDISFCDDGEDGGGRGPGLLGAFYGRPSYPLPAGDTYSSIAVPSRCGGCTYKLLAPTRQVQSILVLHENLSKKFVEWAQSGRCPASE